MRAAHSSRRCLGGKPQHCFGVVVGLGAWDREMVPGGERADLAFRHVLPQHCQPAYDFAGADLIHKQGTDAAARPLVELHLGRGHHSRP